MRNCKLHPGSFWPLRLLWWTPPAWLAGVLVLPLLQGSLPKKGFTHLKQRKLKHDSLLIFFVPRKMEILCGMLINPLSVWSSLGGEILKKNLSGKIFFKKISLGWEPHFLALFLHPDSWTAEAEFGRYRKNFARCVFEMKWNFLDFSFFSYGNADLSKYAKEISERLVPYHSYQILMHFKGFYHRYLEIMKVLRIDTPRCFNKVF